MASTLTIRPANERRRQFAGWAAGHGGNTNSTDTFAVPTAAFPEIPEDLLVGATVDGQPYTSPEE